LYIRLIQNIFFKKVAENNIFSIIALPKRTKIFFMQACFIHIGLPKSGSTFLQHFFKENPEIEYDNQSFESFRKTTIMPEQPVNMPHDKAIHVVSNEKFVIPINLFEVYFKQQKVSDLDAKRTRIAQKLKEFYPNAKIILITREFRSLLQSSYKEYVIKSGTKNFHDFLVDYHDFLLEIYDLDNIYEIYSDTFGKENIIVFSFEELAKNPLAFLSHFQQSWQLHNFDFSEKRINPSLPTFFLAPIRNLSKIAFWFIRRMPKSKQQILHLYYIRSLQILKDRLLYKIKLQRTMGADEELEKLTTELKERSKNMIKETTTTNYAESYF